MFNSHNGTVVYNLLFASSGFATYYFFRNTSNAMIVLGLLLLSLLSLFVLVTNLTRFFINFKKCASAFYKPESIPK